MSCLLTFEVFNITGSKCARDQSWFWPGVKLCLIAHSIDGYFRMPSKYSLDPWVAGGQSLQGIKFGLGSNCAWSLSQLIVRNNKYLWCQAYLLSKNIPLTHGSKLARGEIALDRSLNWWFGTINTFDQVGWFWPGVKLHLIALSIDGS